MLLGLGIGVNFEMFLHSSKSLRQFGYRVQADQVQTFASHAVREGAEITSYGGHLEARLVICVEIHRCSTSPVGWNRTAAARSGCKVCKPRFDKISRA